MAVPRPVLIAILGLALCVTALIAVHGVGGGEDDSVVPAALPEAPPAAQKPVREVKAAPSDKEKAPAPNDKAKTESKPVEQAGQQAVKPAEPKLSSKERTLAAVSKDLAVGEEVVVLFFSKPGAADDTGARSAVRDIRGMKNVAVHTPNFEDLSAYRPILAGTGVSQVPSIVIVKPGQKAQLIEGYVDADSLRQQVTDSLR